MTLVVLSTSTFMGVALSKFVRIVRQAEREHDLNLGYIIVTAAGLAIWAGIWIALSVFELEFYKDKYAYEPVQNALIADSIGIDSNLVNFIIIALVINKSSDVAAYQNED